MHRVGVAVVVALAAACAAPGGAAGAARGGDAVGCFPAAWLSSGQVVAPGARPCSGPDDPGAAGLCRDPVLPQPAGWDLPLCDGSWADGPASGGFTCNPPAPPIASVQVSVLKDGRWRDGSDDLCLGVEGLATVEGGPVTGGQQYLPTYLYNTKDGSFDLSPVLPEGSRVSLRIVFAAGTTPTSGFITGRHVKVAFDGQAMTVEADTARQVIGTRASGECDDPETSRSVFSVSVDFAVPADQPAMPTGMWVASNGDETGTPEPTFGTQLGPLGIPVADGLGMDVSGCGDGDPSTIDGFYEAFVPAATIRDWGLGPALLGDVPDDAAAAVLAFSDSAGSGDADLQVAGASDVDPAPVPGRPLVRVPTTAGVAGVSIDYPMSFSSHHLRMGLRRAGVRAVRACAKRHGRLRGRGRHLRCVRRR